jgi:Protein of unknown function (DUF559)
VVEAEGPAAQRLEVSRQHPIGEYIVDFYCPAARLVIELNGSTHQFQEQFDYDQRRKRWLESQGYTVLTFAAYYPEQDYLEGVWDAIEYELSNVPIPGVPSGASRHLPAERGGYVTRHLPAERGGYVTQGPLRRFAPPPRGVWRI